MCKPSPARLPACPPALGALLTTLAVSSTILLAGRGRCTGLTSRVLGSHQELAIPFIPLAHQAQHQLLQLQELHLEGEVLNTRPLPPSPPAEMVRASTFISSLS